MKKLPIALILLLTALAFTSLHSQDINGEDLEVRLFIVGQGDPVYSYFGHTGLAIANKANGRDYFFDFGNFYLGEEGFFTNFAMGRMLYIAYGAHTETYIRSVKADNRNLREYVLNIPPHARLDMYNALIYKIQPENRTYLYHNYNDNCSTRIRDYIDLAIGGQLEEQTGTSGRTTFRQSFLRHTSHRKLIGTALSILQGQPIDREVTIWQEMFLPSVLEEVVRDFEYIDNKGQSIPLVKAVNVLNQVPERPIVPDSYKHPYIPALLSGLLVALLITGSLIPARRGKRAPFALFNIIAGLFIGVLGSVILFLMVFTDHTYAYSNLNLFMLNPLALFAIPAGILYWRKGKKMEKKLSLIWRIQMAFTVLMILIKVLTPAAQDNLVDILIFLPILTALSLKPTGEAL